MKNNLLYYASTENDLRQLKKGTVVYSSVAKCICQKASEIGSREGINLNFGILTNTLTSKREYTLIERYDNQFQSLNKSICVYVMPKYNTKLEGFKLSEDVMLEAKISIDNLLSWLETSNLYLKQNESVRLISNKSFDRVYYNIPLDNGDIIKKYFLNLLHEKNNKIIKLKTLRLKRLLPNESDIISKLEILMSSMDECSFVLFMNSIYKDKERQMDYDSLQYNFDTCKDSKVLKYVH